MNSQNMRIYIVSDMISYLVLVPLQIYLPLQSLPKHLSSNKKKEIYFYSKYLVLHCNPEAPLSITVRVPHCPCSFLSGNMKHAQEK